MKNKAVIVSDRYYKPEEVAELLQVTKQAVYNWIKEGRLQAVRAGRAVRVSRESLAAFLEPVQPDDVQDEADDQ